MGGWIKLHRQITECSIWTSSEPFDSRSAWIDLLLLANHEDREIYIGGQFKTIKAGSFHTSQVKLADRWRWKRDKVEMFLKSLIKNGMIECETGKSGASRGTTITIIKYGFFQDIPASDSASQGTSQGTSEPHHLGHHSGHKQEHKNNKEPKEEKNIGPRYFSNDDLEDAFREFIKMRNKIKKPMTDRAIDLMIRKLGRMASDPKQQIKILEQSITHCWQDIYELKEEEKPKEEKYSRELLKKLAVNVEDYIGTDQD